MKNPHQPQDIFAEVNLFPILKILFQDLRYYFAIGVFPENRQRKEFIDSMRTKIKIIIKLIL